MADTNKITYVSLENLSYYDGKLKTWVNTKDEALQANIDAEVTRAKAAEATNALAAENAQAAADAAQTNVNNLEQYVGTFTSENATTVVGYIDEKTANIASNSVVNELAERVGQAETDIDNIEKDYLKAADKEEVLAAVNTEKERAMGVEGGLEARLAAVEGDYLVEADKTELAEDIAKAQAAAEAAQADIDAFMTAAEVGEAAVDTLKEIQQYITSDGEAAATMTSNIEANAKAIEDHVKIDHDFAAADATLKADLEAEIALKADKTTVEAMDAAYKSADQALDARLDVLEAIDHEHANKALLDTYTQTEADLADAVAKKHEHENFDVLAAITAAQVAAWNAAEQAAKTYADSLNTAMDARMDAVEAWQANMVECSQEDINNLF